MTAISNWQVGDLRTIDHKFTAKDIYAFAALTGDTNPIHVDANFAKSTATGGQVVHGIFAASFISTLIGVHIPGAGALWHSFEVNWRRPIRIGEEIRFEARIVSIHQSTGSLELGVSGVHLASGEICLEGTAKVISMSEERKVQRGELSGKRVLITGGSGEIGRVIARRLAEEGCRIVLWGRDFDRLKQVADECGSSFEGLHSVDLLDAESIDKSLEATLNGSPVDFFIHAACPPLGYSDFGSLNYHKDLADHLTISAIAFARISDRCLKSMPKGGAIIGILTQAIIDTPPLKMSAYTAGKLAAWGIIKSIALEYGPSGIRCNALSPGLVNSPLVSDVPVRIKQVEAAINPLRRLCTAEDIAEVVKFLCGPDSAFINGANIPVTGGTRMH
jgi:3-oxoacyl-[acyl-carrier protein] reductase